MNKEKFIDLRIFGEGGAALAGGADGQGSAVAETSAGKEADVSLKDVVYGKQGAFEADEAKKSEISVKSDTAEERAKRFEELIKGEFKDLYHERAQKMINARFKETKKLEERLNALDPVMDMLSEKYGVDAKDVSALLKAIEDDSAYYEQEAMDKGMTVEHLKYLKKLERENAAFLKSEAERQQQENADRIFGDWMRQGEELRAIYPNFDLRKEVSPEMSPDTAERFLRQLKAGTDVKTAYELVHLDEILGGAMGYAAQTVRQKVVNDIRARGLRPEENGSSGASAARIVKPDPSKWTKKDREEISRRVMRGERIEL